MSNILGNKFDNSNIFFQNRISDLCFFLSLYFIYFFSNSINFDIIFQSLKIVENNITFQSFFSFKFIHFYKNFKFR